MLSFIIRRILIFIPMMFLVSLVSFVIIELQPGDYASQYIDSPGITPEQIKIIVDRFALDKSPAYRYGVWIKGIVTDFDFGYSFSYKRPVSDLIGERMGWTVTIALLSIIVQWALAVPLGIYSAMHPYSRSDMALTFISFVGVSIPEFFFAIMLMYLLLNMGVGSIGGLFSPEFIGAPFSFVKLLDFLAHVWVPVAVVSLAGLAGLMRVMRGNMLDTVNAPFVNSLRAKGIDEKKIRRHIVKNAINPMVSIAGMQLPTIFSGTIIAAIVLGLPTMGPFFYKALLNHDQHLVMAFLLFIAFITQIGNLLSDIALAILDPRIRMK